ncbi:SBDS protein C-terminal domain-containing protein [Dendryphion nanum]|uniref:SBDS protein C-terminal domain-containing protein n=1 Tax=Dendryphion nanum TaxID=256645 RepID=A0A9P9E132_9PLEO|nr:SBDS protein C-terminal domain-containing protein [Dendryphion nanum]
MPVGIQQPSNQIKLTNVAIVRLKKGKKRFEIACYKNKLLEYRDKIEDNVDDVLQIERIFINVNKGEFASEADLKKAFGDKDKAGRIREILDDGDFQVGEQERHAQNDRIHKEVIDIVAGKLVDPKTKRVYTTGMIEKALDQLSSQAAHQKAEKSDAATAEQGNESKALPQWRGIVPNKPAKVQAQTAINALVAHQPIPVMKAQMRVRITCPTSITKRGVDAAAPAPSAAPAQKGKKGKQAKEAEEEQKGEMITVKEKLLSFIDKLETQEVIGDEWEAVGSIDPGEYKHLNEFIGTHTKGRGRAEVLDMAVKHEDE